MPRPDNENGSKRLLRLFNERDFSDGEPLKGITGSRCKMRFHAEIPHDVSKEGYMKKVRINLTVDWDKSVVDATKAKEIKEGIISELTDFANDAFAELNPSDIKIRFLRDKKKTK